MMLHVNIKIIISDFFLANGTMRCARFQPKEANQKLLQKGKGKERQKNKGTKSRGVEEKQKGDYGTKKETR